MTRAGSFAIALLACLAAAACAGGPGPRGGDRDRSRMSFGSPGAIVAAELAFARAAREKGQWTAFREYAADGAVFFVPQPVEARAWLKGRADPPASVEWQPYEVWVSCDGTMAASRGGWTRPDKSVGYFTTIWQRQDDGGYRWVLDQGDALAKPLAAPEMLAGQIADCPPPNRDGRRKFDSLVAPIGTEGSGRSADGTLEYSYRVAPDLSRTLVVRLRKGGELREVMTSAVAAPPSGG